MAKVEGLNLREGRWHVRIVIPDDLKATYGKARVNPALGTAERREATLLATIKRAEWLAEFEAKRSALTPLEVPAISPELGRLLAERVRATILAGDDSHRSDLLWPVLATREGKPGGYFSHWFGTYRRSLGFGEYPDFHCLRHTVRSQLAEADVPEQVIDAIVGHEVKGSTGAKVYTHRRTNLRRWPFASATVRNPSSH